MICYNIGGLTSEKQRVIKVFKKIIQTVLGEPTGYVSEADTVLASLRKQNSKLSKSQIAEIANAEHIATLRDNA